MKKKLLMVLISVSMIASVFTGCGNSTEAKDSGKAQTEQADTKEDSADKADEEQAALEDGTYTAEFQTDSSMFHVNEAMDGKGTLTVEDGKMTIHISLVSKNIVNLFEGTAEDAQKDGAELLQPTTDTINYSDGTSDEVYGFDVPVPALDKEFDLALIGKKGTWYDHKVSVSNPEPKEDDANKKFKQLSKMAKAKLNRVGANVSKVPMAVRVFNVMLFFISIIIALIHFQYNKLNIYNPEAIKGISIEIIEVFLLCFPMLLGILYIPIYLMICTRHRVNKAIRKFTGQKVVTTTVTIVLIFFVVMLITLLFGESLRFLIIDELLISISLIIMLTDNLMLKNESIMIEDFSRLNMIKDKLEDDTLFKDRDVEQVTLWEKYLAYAVAFGVADKIIKRIKEINIDDDLEKILESKMLFDDIASGYYNFYANASLDRRFVKGYSRITGEVLSSMRRSRIFWRKLFRRKRPEDFLVAEDFLAEVAEEAAGGAF